MHSYFCIGTLQSAGTCPHKNAPSCGGILGLDTALCCYSVICNLLANLLIVICNLLANLLMAQFRRLSMTLLYVTCTFSFTFLWLWHAFCHVTNKRT